MSEDRRRRGKTGKLNQKLGVDPATLDPNFEHRWINDEKTRIHDLTVNDDWDLVDAKDPKSEQDGRKGLGSAMCRFAGSKADGSAQKTYLARKRKDYFEADRAEKRAEMRKAEAAIKAPSQDPNFYGEVKIQRN